MLVQVYRARVKTFRADIDASKRQITKVKSFGRPTSAREELFSKGEQVMASTSSVSTFGQRLTFLTACSAGRGWRAKATAPRHHRKAK
jgi:hypothetical protein